MDQEQAASAQREGQDARNNDVYRRMCELEQELVEFQESSKELEQALEDELQQLEEQNAKLELQSRAKDIKIVELNKTVINLTAEINKLSELLAETKRANNHTISDLKQQLVTMEILNEDMLSQDRVLEHKFKLAQQFNNELLEKLALVENDLELERELNAKNTLLISNLENSTVKKLQIKRDETLEDLTFADGTILDINEMLASEPPQPPRLMPKLGSLHMIHELYHKSDVLLTKVGNLSTTLKSSTTTDTDFSSITAKAKDVPTTISHASSVSNLTKLQDNNADQRREVSRSTVKSVKSVKAEGSNGKAPKPVVTDSNTKKSWIRDLMKSMIS